MDKNNVSVDNLVKQRLSGAEEKEREGAWLQMRDLLDKEMPQNKPFGFSMRRPALYAGAMLLIATLAIFGLKTKNPEAFALFSRANGVGPIGEQNSGNPAQIPADNEATSSADQNRTTNISSGTNQVAASASTAAATKHLTAKGIGNDQLKENNTGKIDELKYNKKHAGAAGNNDKGAKSVAGKQTNINSDNNDGNLVSNKTDKKQTKKDQALAKSNPSHSHKTGEKSLTADLTSASSKRNEHTEAEATDATEGSLTADANTSSQKHQSALKQTKHPVLSSSVSDHVRSIARANRKHAAQKQTDDQDMNDSYEDVAQGENDRKNKIEVDHLYRERHFVNSEASKVAFTFDTISKERLFEQLHSVSAIAEAATEKKEDMFGDAVASNNNFIVNNYSAAKEGANAEPSLKSAVEAKMQNKEHKESAGAKMVENLTETFNEIKYNASEMTFTKGLTAGLNSSFFGPANFNGFQFGVTGDFNFGDNIAIGAEFKFFERIHNGYVLNDDYYTYESLGGSGGGYKKSKIDYDFYFSTLQSFELPVMLKYKATPDFTVFGGANFLYMFGINTGAEPLPDPSAPTKIVQTPGKDTVATMSYKDFGQRFGIGYLFGFTFNVGQNSAIDVRAVQTFWDNLSSPGSKAVSNILYNSPSIQLSYKIKLGKDKRNGSK